MFERRFFALSLVFFNMQYNVVKRLPAAASTFSRSKYVINETKQIKQRNQKRSSETERVNECDDREWIKKWCHFFDFCLHSNSQYGKWQRCQSATHRWFKWVVVASSFAIANWTQLEKEIENIEIETKLANLPREKHGSRLISAPKIWFMARSKSPTSKQPT